MSDDPEVWVSPIDRHFHYGDAGRAECAVCCLEADRDHWRVLARREAAEADRLREGIMSAEVHGELIVRMRESVWREHEDQRDRLRAVVDAVLAFERDCPFFGAVVPGDSDNTEDEERRAAVAQALDQLDASPTGEAT